MVKKSAHRMLLPFTVVFGKISSDYIEESLSNTTLPPVDPLRRSRKWWNESGSGYMTTVCWVWDGGLTSSEWWGVVRTQRRAFNWTKCGVWKRYIFFCTLQNDCFLYLCGIGLYFSQFIYLFIDIHIHLDLICILL